jgi:hypothetical protein
LPPSPVNHTTRVGVAVAVTLTPGTLAVADRGPHVASSTHNHIGSITNCGAGGGGLNSICGAGGASRDTAI